MVDQADRHLQRWLARDPENKPYHAEWLEIVTSWPMAEIVAVLTVDTEEGRGLRQSSLFTGILSPGERQNALDAAHRAWTASR